MKYTKLSAAAALLAGSALVLSACAPGGPAENSDTGSAAPEGNGEVATGDFGEKYTVEPADTGLADLGEIETQDGSIAYSVGEDEFISYNSMTPETYSTYNSAVTERLISTFAYFGTDGQIYQNEEYGTYEKVSDDPLTVKYTINEEAVWSDGTPVTAADYILKWGVENPRITTGSGEEAAPLFNAISQSFGEYVSEAPEGDPAGKEFTITFKEPYADWPILVDTALPAHVVAEESGMGMDAMLEAVRNEDAKALAPAAEFWNTGWNTSPGTLPDESIAPSNGPYTFKSWEPGQSITLTANENYWGTPPATKELVIRFAAADTHVQALANGDLNVIEPQATVDTLSQLEDLGDQIVIQTGASLTWEHLDFNFMDGSPFADNLELRKAFAMCVPRQQIVDNLIKPVDPEAVVMNAREVFPFQDTYQEVVDAAYDGSYDEVDVEGAKKIVEAEGAEGTKVRIGYSAPNPRRSDTVAAIKSSCDEAGFVIEDVGSADFFDKTMPQGDYEVALFAWAGSGQIASGRNIYHSTGQQNYGKFSNKEVDAAWDTLAGSVDPAVHAEQVKVIEKGLWDNLFGIPLYAHPGVVAHSADVANVRDTATQSGAVWNAQQWVRAE
ncbi:ABC transporter family substrate-binding protein [Citricoccus sp.]|uniref:ABC transporter family substrate-binding protein n=1 Tax=Citricoccus sp. TaxID=1978372 RepID=UPI0026034B7E|nr:ABC transporter family substrate-binding protein [Citricoccus sp.]HRO29667.1 ABC transporter family substrate-binding protein [Citricoccus sp.]HRO94042.1 ABC transporter family substrate-binding protein [Citricoccus sp.]